MIVLAKLFLFALALPAFEGTDEPFHLDRARAFAAAPLDEGWAGRSLAPEVVAAVEASPCGADLRRAFGCPEWGGWSAWFNVLSPAEAGAAAPGAAPVANYQDHQPPLYYAVAGGVLRLVAPGAGPRVQLLVLRLLAVLLVAGGVGLCFRFLGPELRLALLAALLLPGAAEALVRAGQEAAVFLWCAGMLAMVVSGSEVDPGGGANRSARGEGGVAGGVGGGSRAWKSSPVLPAALLFLLAATGPLIKLTAIPIVAFAALQRFWRRRWWQGAAIALGGLAVFPLQLARGWALGGTLELNAPPVGGAADWWEPVVGVAHSAYTFAKTALWLGGWSVFRPPAWVLVAAVLLALAWLPLARPRRPPRNLPAHLGALLLAAAGFVAFAVGKHRVFGVWGAVGGWYLWAWLPWLLLAHRDLVRFPYRRGAGRWWAVAVLAFLLAVNAAWLVAAHHLYGG